MNKKIQLSVLSIFIAAALVGSIVAYGDNMAYAGGKNKKHNDMEQFINQFSGTGQASSCGSNDDTIASCNNLAFTANLNDGDNAAGQQ
jgi:hypothetical protein